MRKKIKHNKISSLKVNNELQTEPQKIAESFNKFFSEIGENLAKKLQMTELITKNTSKTQPLIPCFYLTQRRLKSLRS